MRDKLFWRHVGQTNGCWLWTGGVDRGGYGRFRHQGRLWQAHRFAWHLAARELPVGLVLRHTCDTPACVRLDHLALGTKADNAKDMVDRGRSLKGDRNPRRQTPERFPLRANAKLTLATVAVIRRRYRRERLTQVQLGDLYGVNYRTIGRIVRNETW